MKRPHVAIFTQMGNGHLYPMLPLCAELAARGYRVTCPANHHYARAVIAASAEAVTYTETPVSEPLCAENRARAQLPVTDPSRFETTPLEWEHIANSCRDYLAQVAAFYEQNVPDLILYSRYCLPGRILAQRLGSPVIQLSPHFAYRGETRYWEHGEPRAPEGIVAYASALDDFLATQGITTRGNLWHVEDLNIHLIPHEFQYRADLFDARFLFVSSPLARVFKPAWTPPASERPVLLISNYSGLAETQASYVHYFRTFIDGLADCGWHCVLSIGELPPEALGLLPDHFEVNKHASHLEILPHAALLVCHGGMGTTLEALYNGVPVLAIPNSPYTHEIGSRTLQLGAGALLPHTEFGVDSVTASIRSMLADKSLQERAKTLQQVLQHSDGVASAADRVARFLLDEQTASVP